METPLLKPPGLLNSYRAAAVTAELFTQPRLRCVRRSLLPACNAQTTANIRHLGDVLSLRVALPWLAKRNKTIRSVEALKPLAIHMGA